MAEIKRRVFQHIMEDSSYHLIRELLPKEWVIREFNRPDYGIDLVIELFNKIDEQYSETLGEYIYVQVKSVKSIEITKEKIYNVGNVAKGGWKEDRSKYAEIDVIKYVFDTNSLYTIQSLGASVSVLLFVADLATGNVYFVCLNDYIDKILLPKQPDYANQGTVTLTIPAWNNLQNKPVANNAMKFYGKRAKLLAAFSKFSYQKNEIAHAFMQKDYPVITYRDELEKGKEQTREDTASMLLYFIGQIEGLDIWEHAEWSVLPETKKEIQTVKALLSDEKSNWNEVKNRVLILWHQLTNLGTMYEDLCREWFLPKLISLMTSYPTSPEIINAG
ncbi:DUF4365 domain-containing protein [Flaviaesturariibacter aridisoli]|uniref:DUF4365 domain-containing protein n=1 Tax=Flaviaesturariibacter aridisoli TaxID=2545761 RepID=A0A4R4E195_9BACT|nr:DUF4365 domain-containing protein [Flaviaesturariibacter aridisoli]TCZ68341.1 DUF4365 domain-containing protein [Flaviaesturariibacter aridisoli]